MKRQDEIGARLPLPIDAHVPAILETLRARHAVVVVAPPGSGKTTRIPPALISLGPLILLQPRRLAARSLAKRIALEQGFEIGREIGWQVRFERRFSKDTRLLVATEGVLTARLQSDPLLSGFATVVLDEFHERSLHADLALALSRQAARARGDLNIVVMSATLDARPVSSYLGDCPIVEVAGRPYPVEITHDEIEPATAIRRALARPGGHVLCFLAGMGDIRRVASEIAGVGAEVLPLHGTLSSEEQDAALAPRSRRKVLLATNIAETSITVDGVTDVIDSGVQRVMRFDPAKGIDRLVTERIPQDSADQRAGRAGRTGPGRALRLWSARDVLRAQREPEIRRVDLASPFLEVLAWGGDPMELEWFEAPPEQSGRAAFTLLQLLGAVEGRHITQLGETLRKFPLHPRLARVLVLTGGSRKAAAACAVLSERDFLRGDSPTSDCDLLARIDAMGAAPAALRDVARELFETARQHLGTVLQDESDHGLRRALHAGFPDRVARRREKGAAKLLLASGSGATLARESGVRDAEYLVALELSASDRAGSDPLVRLASKVDAEWLHETSREVVHRFDSSTGSVRASTVTRHQSLVLSETPVAVVPEEASRMLAAALLARGWSESDRDLMRRMKFAGLDVNDEAQAFTACAGLVALKDVSLASSLPFDVKRRLDDLAPASIEVPSGRRHALEYREDGTVALAVKLQELFGLAETPRVGPRREPVLIELLSPGGRPVQSTRDLRSFWTTTYAEVRKELRARYPRHPWPEDPWTALPTHRAKPRGT